MLLVSATCPVKPFWPVIVMVETPTLPAFIVTLLGAAETAKSGGIIAFTVKITETE